MRAIQVTTASPAQNTRRRRGSLVGLAALIVLAAVGWWLVPDLLQARFRTRLTQQLHSAEPETRKQAAWAVADRDDQYGTDLLVSALLADEPDEAVREAYVYALGRAGDPSALAAIENVIDRDPSGYVRAAAWLAIARLDPQHFATLACTTSAPEQPWNQIGLAQGALEIGDVSRVDTLLHWAEAGTHTQRIVASRALYKRLRPLLDTAGRWPLDADVAEGEPWTAELIEQVRTRVAQFDIQAIANDSRPHEQVAEQVRRTVARITRARDRLAGALFGK